ncbi:ectonucleotide pyrophosphatase/phosphodiesterase [Granulicella cerasi]|uniref:Ectonucleotide pyrophosphatase/phosphodiesterase n=1 Tax=Granulicella cerasi TaxID=741063 RepID=A0ABW1Z841_9BACT|nr:ectonucleotide pyrophosphatase/phosphodiesterase [Granulicella cerasi]
MAMVIAVALPTCANAQQLEVIQTSNRANSADAKQQPYVVLVSLDGFRFDYARRFHAKHLLWMASHGASTREGMIPSFPSLTFPNHYTLVTGLYPEHHGIVQNGFYDPVRNETYDAGDPKTSRDGSWYGGVPLWVLAARQGMRSACMFWPGSEAEIDGYRPTYYLNYDEHISNRARVMQVMSWLALREDLRPHFITLYFSDADEVGHKYGVDSPELKTAVRRLDSDVSLLLEKVRKTHLPVDILVVSDHGMVDYRGNLVNLATFGQEAGAVKRVGLFLYPGSDAEATLLYNELSGKSPFFDVYRRAAVPNYLHFNSNARSGDPVLVAKGPYRISRAPLGAETKPSALGNHGYDPRQVPEMKASFFAVGPGIAHLDLPSFENVDIYPFVARLLHLDEGRTMPEIDGSLRILGRALRK